MKFRKYNILIILILFFSGLIANSVELEKKLESVPIIDKIKILIELAKEHDSIPSEKAIIYAKRAERLAVDNGLIEQRIMSLNTLGNLYKLVYDQENSLKYLFQALEISNDHNELFFETMLNISSSYLTFNEFILSYEFALKSLKFAEKNNDKNRIGRSYKQIGFIYFRIENYNMAIDYYEQALQIQIELEDHDSIIRTLINLSNCMKRLKDYDGALTYLRKALNIKMEPFDINVYATALSYQANIYVGKKDFDSALKNFEEALQYYREIDYKIGIGRIYNDLGYLYKLRNDFNKALEYNQLALQKRQEINNIVLVASSLRNIGVLYFDQKNYDIAKGFFEDALTIAIETDHLEIMEDVYSRMTELYIQQKDFSNALKFSKKYREITDRISEMEISSIMLERFSEYQIGKLEVENKLLLKNDQLKSLELEHQKTLHYGFIAVIVLGLIIIILLVNTIRIKILINKKLNLQVKDSDLKYKKLIENLGEGVSIVDQNENIIFANQAAEVIFGVERNKLTDRNLVEFVDSEAYKKIQQESNKRQKGMTSVYDLIINKADNTKGIINVTSSPIYNEKNDITSTLSIFRDVTAQKEAEAEIKNALEEKNILLKEIHHRVKNNLQIITSLLSLQSRKIKDQKFKNMFTESLNRIYSMSLVHQQLYHTTNLVSIDMNKYIGSLTEKLLNYNISGAEIELKIDVEDILFNLNTAIPFGLIVNELVTNALKHGFPETSQQGSINISLQKIDEKHFKLIVRNDGKKIPDDIENFDSLGMKLIRTLTEQLHGELEIPRSDGAEFIITFVSKE